MYLYDCILRKGRPHVIGAGQVQASLPSSAQLCAAEELGSLAVARARQKATGARNLRSPVGFNMF